MIYEQRPPSANKSRDKIHFNELHPRPEKTFLHVPLFAETLPISTYLLYISRFLDISTCRYVGLTKLRKAQADIFILLAVLFVVICGTGGTAGGSSLVV